MIEFQDWYLIAGSRNGFLAIVSLFKKDQEPIKIIHLKDYAHVTEMTYTNPDGDELAISTQNGLFFV
jgi:hypothetical protein